MGSGASKEAYDAAERKGAQAEAARDVAKARIVQLEKDNAAQQLLLNPKEKPQNMLDPRAYNPDFAALLAAILKFYIVHAAMFGLASAGKSSVFNFFVRCIAMNNGIGGHHVGEAAANGGQFSTQCVREPLCHGNLTTWDSDKMGEILVTDTVGFKGNMDEFRAICYGQMKQVEKYPRDDSQTSTLLKAQIAQRPKDLRASVIVLFISAQQLINPVVAERDAAVKSILKGAKEELYVGDCQVEVPLMVVVTKCDLVGSDDGNFSNAAEPSDLVNQRTAPRLQQVFKLCFERFGVSKDNIFCLGWLNDTDKADFSANSKDPRVLAARSAIIALAEGATRSCKKFEQLLEPKFTRVGRVHQQTANQQQGQGQAGEQIQPPKI